MRRKKSAQKTAGKKDSAGRKLSGRKKSSATKEDGRGWLAGRKSAQIHQGVGPEAQAEPPEIPDDATEYGGES